MAIAYSSQWDYALGLFSLDIFAFGYYCSLLGN
jgi:hypothetical protein